MLLVNNDILLDKTVPLGYLTMH